MKESKGKRDRVLKFSVTAEDEKMLKDFAETRRLPFAVFLRFAVFQYCRRYDK